MIYDDGTRIKYNAEAGEELAGKFGEIDCWFCNPRTGKVLYFTTTDQDREDGTQTVDATVRAEQFEVVKS